MRIFPTGGLAVALSVAGVLACAVSWAQSESDECEWIDPHKALTWEYNDGPDFYVCYGNTGDPTFGLVGFYVGYAPAFEAEGYIQRGNVGDEEVIWYDFRGELPGYELGLHTLVSLALPDGNSIRIHIWMFARDDASLDSLLKIAEEFSLENVDW